MKQQPVFELNALFVFAKPPLTDFQRRAYQLMLRSGRPVVRFGVVDLPVDQDYMTNLLLLREFEPGSEAVFEQWIANRPRTNYQPIDCNFYDEFEAAITNQQPVELTYRTPLGRSVTEDVLLLDTRTEQKEEYVQFEDGRWIRLDRIVAVNGKAAGDSCRF